MVTVNTEEQASHQHNSAVVNTEVQTTPERNDFSALDTHLEGKTLDRVVAILLTFCRTSKLFSIMTNNLDFL